MKTWLIHTQAPYCGTDQYYAAYSEEDPSDWLYENFYDGECDDLYQNYSFRLEEGWEDDWNNFSEEEKSAYGSYDNYMDEIYREWCEDCIMEVSECSEDELDDYAPENCKLDIIYDERKK